MEIDFKRDPWVKVGTTTIDGTLVDIANVLDVSSWPINWDRDAVAAIDMFMRAQEPWLVGGRHLVAQRSHVNEHAGTAIIHCDIVRRQSEIDKEMMRSVAPSINELSATMRRMDPCPECGPHGNRGEVLLASSWAKCTTCAGGKPGDLWGEVQAEPSLPTGTVRRPHDIDPRARRTMVYFASGRTETFDVPAGATRISIDDDNETVEFNHQAASEAHRPGGGFPDDKFSIKESPDLSGPLTVTIGGRGFKVPTISEMHGAALDNLYLYLCGEPDGMSREEYRRIMFGEWVP